MTRTSSFGPQLHRRCARQFGRMVLALLLGIAALLWARDLPAQETDIGALIREYQDLQSKRAYREAIPLAERAAVLLDIEPRRSDDVIRAQVFVLTDLGNLYDKARREAEAETVFTKAIAITEKQWGREHPMIAKALKGMARLERMSAEGGEAEQLLWRAYSIEKRAYGTTDLRLSDTVAELGTLYWSWGRPKAAEAQLKEAIHIAKAAGGANSATYLASYALLLGDLYVETSRFTDAEAAYREALQTMESDPGRNQFDLAIGLYRVGMVLDYQQRAADALPYLERALAIIDSENQNTEPYRTDVLQNLAAVYRELDREADAEVLDERLRMLQSTSR